MLMKAGLIALAFGTTPALAAQTVYCIAGDPSVMLANYAKSIGGRPLVSMMTADGPMVIVASPSGEWLIIILTRGMACLAGAGSGMKSVAADYKFPTERAP